MLDLSKREEVRTDLIGEICEEGGFLTHRVGFSEDSKERRRKVRRKKREKEGERRKCLNLQKSMKKEAVIAIDPKR
jgi:hypothetical protein